LFVFACTVARAEAISPDDAHNQCTNWTHYMDTKTSVCGYCELIPIPLVPQGKPRCHWYVCDDDGNCESTTIERRTPKGRWRSVHPRRTVQSR
jgi:hypothetical protein